MIVVIVRKDYRVNRRQAVEFNSRRDPAPGPNELQWRRTHAPNRIEENVQSRDLDEKARMADPRHSEQVRSGPRHEKGRVGSSEHTRVGIGASRISPPLHQRPFEKIHKPVHLS